MLDTQMPRNSQRDNEDFHKEPTIEQALIISQRKQLEQQAKSIDELVEGLFEASQALNWYCSDIGYQKAVENLQDKYRAIANKHKTDKQDK